MVIDRLLQELLASDLRLTGSKILELVEKERGEDSSAETSQRLILHYLNQISDLKRKSEAAASIIQAIDEVHEDLILQLAKFVTDSSATGYEQVQVILSRIQLNKESEDYLLPLLRVTAPTAESQEQLNLFIRRSYLGMGETEVPEALQNVQVTPEGTLQLLKLIFEQKKIIDKLASK
ncbi:hypothetical protein [Candidatus Odyssella thessalonicensis]|uniref:hypothetical protein n=1 Tax=Candidatus Odyssella thessalonicensis TaxID=84647 RepID=UPI000225BF73|nr:hypothetical protein [Candidatus Odyssella thessalonicensis]